MYVVIKCCLNVCVWSRGGVYIAQLGAWCLYLYWHIYMCILYRYILYIININIILNHMHRHNITYTYCTCYVWSRQHTLALAHTNTCMYIYCIWYIWIIQCKTFPAAECIYSGFSVWQWHTKSICIIVSNCVCFLFFCLAWLLSSSAYGCPNVSDSREEEASGNTS